MKYVVQFPDGWWLRNTVATGSLDRATRYDDRAEAQKALARAKPFFKRAAMSAAQIMEVANE